MVHAHSQAFDRVLLQFDHLTVDIRESRKKLEKITELRLNGNGNGNGKKEKGDENAKQRNR